MLKEIINGALISGSLIIAIGAQNLFVLKQGLLKNHIFWICLICFTGDFMLMSVGVLGVGTSISKSLLISKMLGLVGAAFLLWYGFSSFKNAYQGKNSMSVDENNKAKNKCLFKVVLSTLSVTFLNPHVYLDTVVIVGGIAATLTMDQKIAFLIGAVSVSFIWFFGIGYGVRLLSPLFKQKRMWVILDFIVGCVMWYIASLLMVFVVNN